MGRHKLYVLFRHMIKQPQKFYPSYVQMAVRFTETHPVFVNPSITRMRELGSLISFDTEGANRLYMYFSVLI